MNLVGQKVARIHIDANGNLTNDGAGKVYAYDAANRVVSVTQGGTTTGFVYDGLGRHVQETSNGALVKQWVWQMGALQPCEERDANNNVTKRFYALGEQINGTPYFVTKDHLGNIREMTNNAGGLVARYDYDPYGRRTLVSGTDLSDFGFTGFYHDQATNSDFSWTRIYNADLGRWTSPDTIGEAGGTNRYTYAGGNPINRIDPSGEIFGADDAIEGDAYLVGWAVVVGGSAYAAWRMEQQSAASLQEFLDRMHARNEARKEEEQKSKSCPKDSPSTPPAPPKGPCFAAGTLVSTPDGEKKIEDIKAGDTVYAYDFKSGRTVERKVIAIQRHFTYHWVDVELGSETIRATRAHPFWVESEKRWVAAIDLKPGMMVHLQGGRMAMVSETILHDLTQPEATYNLVVDADHDYFVGDLQVLVHNGGEAGPPPYRGAAPVGDDGYPVELHHNGQNPDSPLDEMTRTDHRLGDNFAKNHENTGQDPSKIDRAEFNKTRQDYWKKEWDKGRWDDDEDDDGCE